jgi:hypothetical protein
MFPDPVGATPRDFPIAPFPPILFFPIFPDCGSPESGPTRGAAPRRMLFIAEPDFGVASINYDLSELLSKAVAPEQTI